MSVSSTIRKVSYSDILGDSNAQVLLEAYAAECSIPVLGSINPQSEIYSALEQSGSSRCFGVYEGDELVGFANELTSILPHYGRMAAVVESLYVGRSHRSGGTGIALMDAVEGYAREAGCAAILYSAPAGSRFDKLLAARRQYACTNIVYCRSLR